jgi:uncharacterized damage-inducible protein DinB
MEITTIDPFLKYFSNIRERTLRVARCIPPDQINWSPTPGKFTFADILRHIAVTERYMFAENVQNNPSRYTTHGPELAVTPDEIFALLDRLHAESMQIFASLTDADLQRKCTTPGGSAITTWKWLRSMTSEEVRSRSSA